MKVHVEIEVPELDTVKLIEPVKAAMEKALREYTEKILNDRAAFFLITNKDLQEMFISQVREELKKKAIAAAEAFTPKIALEVK